MYSCFLMDTNWGKGGDINPKQNFTNNICEIARNLSPVSDTSFSPLCCIRFMQLHVKIMSSVFGKSYIKCYRYSDFL